MWSNFNDNTLTIFGQVKKLWNISEKDWLNLSNQQFLLSFLHTKNTQEGWAFMRSRYRFPWSHQFLPNFDRWQSHYGIIWALIICVILCVLITFSFAPSGKDIKKNVSLVISLIYFLPLITSSYKKKVLK